MKALTVSVRFALLVAAVSISQLVCAGIALSAEALTLESLGVSTPWKIKAKVTDRKIQTVWINESTEGTEAKQATITGTPAGARPTEYEVVIPPEFQGGAASKELVATFILTDINDKSAAPVQKRIVFKNGIYSKKPLSTERLIPPTQTHEVSQNISEIIANSPVSDSAKQLTKWILDRALNWKDPGVAYFDHQPKKTAGAFAKVFSDLAKSASASKQLTAPSEIDAKIKELRQAMRDGLDEVYKTRGVKEDWQPFLFEIQNHVGDSHSDQPATGATAQSAFDLNNLEHIAAVFAAIAAAFNELSATHEKVEKYFLGGGSLAGSGASFGGSSSATSRQFGSSECDECKCRRRHRTCWSLLLGL